MEKLNNMYLIILTILYVGLIVLIIYVSIKLGRKEKTNVLQFRTYHRIEYLKKKRLEKLNKQLGKKEPK